jgi:hypothetical protein
MNSGGARSMNGTTGSQTMSSTSLGMRSRCLAYSTTRNCARSEPVADTGATSKMSAENPNTS